MERITYGAPRLVDWVAQIKAGAATVRVHFTGGALTSYGVTPAEYTTDNPFIQKVIEQSTYFKEGRIKLLRRSEIAAAPKPKAKTLPAPQPQTVRAVSGTAAPASAEGQEAAASVADKADTGLTRVEATCLQDAQAYLQEHFNIASYKVRSYEAAQRAASEHGVLFVGARFDTVNGGGKDEGETAEAVE